MNITIRPETPEDYEAVRKIVTSSFPSEAEARLIDMLRANGRAIVSLVAEQQGLVIGHILFSPVNTSPASRPNGLGLAPVAVTAEYRSRGVG
ncbi:MAG: N-acetyltransferase, partial [Chloroflexota bacterium]